MEIAHSDSDRPERHPEDRKDPRGDAESRASHARVAAGDVSRELLVAAQSGDRPALEEFVRHYQGPVFAFVSRSMGPGPHVDDVAQEVFLRVIRALPQFVQRQAKISTWIFQIAVRLMQDRRKKLTPVLLEVIEQVDDRGASPEQVCAGRRALSRVEELAAQMPEEQRMALVLFEFHGLSHEEIAQAMGVGASTVKTRVFRARQFLRAGLDPEEVGKK